MRLTSERPDDKSLEGLYTAEAISADDIPEPSQRWLRFVHSMKGDQPLSSFTVKDFAKHVKQRFTSND